MWTPSLAASFLFLAGCGSSSSSAEPSNAFFTFRWLIVGAFLVVAAIVAVVAFFQLLQGELGPTAGLSLLALLVASPALLFQPGFVSPREHWRRTAEMKTTEASAPYQLSQARAARVKLEAHIATLEPLRRKYDREHAATIERLGPAIRRAGVKTHRDLLERGASEQDTVDMLHRAAVLERALPMLERRSRDVTRTIAALAQKEWELTHMIELEAVASPAELDDVRRILAHAEALVDERTSPPEKQDVAELEAGLFDRLVKGH